MLFKKNETIIFIGDSITDCGRFKPAGEGCLPANPYGNGYVALSFAYLRAKYPHLHLRIINQGTDGDRSADILRRYSDIILYKPDWVIVMIGVNDVWRYFDCPEIKEIHVDCTAYRQNLESIIKQNKENDIKTIFLSPFIIETNPQDAMRQMLDVYRAAMHQLTQKYGLHYVDIQKSFDLLLQEITGYELSRDRIHPNIVGHMVILQTLIDYIESR